MSKKVLTLDLGNTALAGGFWEGEVLRENWSLALTGGPFRRRLKKRLQDLKEGGGIDSAILASVVPQKTEWVLSLCRSVLNVEAYILTANTPTGLKITYHHPEKVGADRIANAVGAYRLYGGPVIVVDFGTAITFDVISKKFEYLGGVIAPGLEISTQALFKKAALLPRIKISVPEKILGQDTASAIRSGVFYGTLGLVERIIKELKNELGWGKEVRLVATGGQAKLILSGSRIIKAIDPFLTLKGLYLIAQKLEQKT